MAFRNIHSKKLLFIFAIFYLATTACFSQHANFDERASAKYLEKISGKTNDLNSRIDKTKTKYLKKYFKAENRLHKKLCKKDPALADKLFSYSKDPLYYNQQNTNEKAILKNQTASKEYFAQFDTLKSSVNFLKKDPNILSGNQELDQVSGEIDGLDKNLASSDKLQQYFRQRKLQFKDAVLKYPELQNDYLKMDKVNYYFGQQLDEYKNLFSIDQSKAEDLIKNALQGNSAFNEYMKNSGELAAFSKATNNQKENLNGMQTMAQTKAFVQKDIEALGSNAKSIIEERMQPMSEAMSKLKNGSFTNNMNAADLPDFTPHPLKTKRFIDRIHHGVDFQFGNVNYFFPASCSLGFQVSYQLTMRSTAGIGYTYNAGLGKSWDNTKVSTNGYGYRSFVDYQLKGIFFLQGGYEKNYTSEIPAMLEAPYVIKGEKLKIPSHWRQSTLLGLKLKYKLNKKSSATMNLMYDFLHNKNVPASPALIYRMGWER